MRLGPYEVEETLGRGGSATVYRGRSPSGEPVAIKVLHRANADTLARFEREARLTGELGAAEGFVELRDTGMGPGGPFIVLTLVPGGTLRDRLARGPLDVADTLVLGRTLALALGRAHALGVVHRDVKPENILFTRPGPSAKEWGSPLVADLGLAKHFALDAGASLSRTGELRGTAGYMPPEQLTDAKTAGPAADVFALGAILYECLAGEPPFRGDSVLEVITQASQGGFVPLAKRRGSIPRSFAHAIERALAPEPAARFADGTAFARALAPSTRARWPLLGLTAAALLLLGAGALLSLLLGGGAPWSKRPRGAEGPPPSPPPSPPPAVAPAPPVKSARAVSTYSQLLKGSAYVRLARVLGESARKLPGQILNAEVSPDGRHFVTGDGQGLVRLVDLEEEREEWTVDVGVETGAYAFDPAHGQVLAGTVSGEVLLLDAKNGARAGALAGNGKAVAALAVSADGRRVFGGSRDAGVLLWDRAKGGEPSVLFGHTKPVVSVALSLDGRRGVSASLDGLALVWNLDSDDPPLSVARSEPLHAVDLAPDGKSFAVGGRAGRVELRDAATGALLGTRDVKNWVFSLSFARDGTLAVGDATPTVDLLDGRTGDLVRAVPRHALQVSLVRCRGPLVVSASWDQSVRLTERATGAEVRPLVGHAGRVSALAFSADGLRLFSAGRDRVVHTWDLVTAEESRSAPSAFPIRVLTRGASDQVTLGSEQGIVERLYAQEAEKLLAPDTGLIVGARSTAHGLFVATDQGAVGIAQAEKPSPPLLRVSKDLKGFDVDDEGRLAIAGGAAGLEVIDLARNSKRRAPGEGAVTALALSRDGSVALAARASGSLERHDLADKRLTSVGSGSVPATAVALSPDLRLFACARGDLLEVGSATGPAEVERVDFASTRDRPASVAFSPDGKMLAVGTAAGVVLIYRVE